MIDKRVGRKNSLKFFISFNLKIIYENTIIKDVYANFYSYSH